ncbi:MAG: DUF4307 domain-containing protein [Egibacteraceae bacterium]
MPPDLLAERYGATRRRPLGPLIAASTMAVVFLGWLAWTAWFHATPDARSELTGYDIVGENTALGTVDVRLAGDVDPEDVTCLLRATAYDHTTVGELRFAPRPGRSDYEVRTERAATTVDLIGCTTSDQPRPR